MSEREEIIEAIRSTGTITKAAKRLGIHRRTLQDRMNFLGLKESEERAVVLGGRGKRGRPKAKFKGRARAYASAAMKHVKKHAGAYASGVAVLAVGVGVAVSRKKPSIG